MKKVIFIFLISGLTSGLLAQDISKITLKDVSSSTKFELKRLTGAKASVIVFYSINCAYNDYYAERLKKLAEEFSSSGIEMVLVNSNKNDFRTSDWEIKMKNMLSKSGLNLPYLADESQALKNTLGASRSPEVFLITFSGSQVTKVYSGAIDDSPQSEGDVNHPYLREAIITLLQGDKPEVNFVRPAGCLIR